jgi:translation initiation factor 3 subunit H|tara:strand:- start:1800 stop:2834 length:1035 start_codon:yes stop_codon:yes gene_type:complete
MNFAAQAAAANEKKTAGERVPVTAVELDGGAALKIMTHCADASPGNAAGQLLGLDVGGNLDVTACFPFPRVGGEDDHEGAFAAEEGAEYQLDMMRCLREINVDSNAVGWYQSTYLGTHYNGELIETFLSYSESIKRCVCVVYDPTYAEQGVCALKALKLSEKFLEAYDKGKHELTLEKIHEKGLKWDEIVVEVPLTIRNSALATAVMDELARNKEAELNETDYERLDLSTAPFVEENMKLLGECMEDFANEQQRVAYFQRNMQRYHSQHAHWLHKRRQENARRRAAGEELLPEEDPNYKAPKAPSRLENLLITNQVAEHVDHLENFTTKTAAKLELVTALRGGN